MRKFVTVYGTDPEKISEPVPVVDIPPHIQVVDKSGAVVFSLDPKADFDEFTANTEAQNSAKAAEHQTLLAKLVEQGKEAPPVPEPYPLPDLKEHYRLLLNRWKISVAAHNGQSPDDRHSLAGGP